MEYSMQTENPSALAPPSILAISMVKNEQDVIEAMVRHNLRFVERLVVVDNGSVDGTRNILHKLSQEFSQLVVTEDDRFGYDQSERMTRYLHQYQAAYPSDFVMALDADEFLDVADSTNLRAAIAGIPVGGYGLIPWCTYVLTPDQIRDSSGDRLRLMEWRRREELPGYFKAIIRLDRAPADQLEFNQGNHFVRRISGDSMPVVQLHWLRLLHYPVRSKDQLIAKNIVGWMAHLVLDADAGEKRAGGQWRCNFDRFVQDTSMDDQALCESSLLYAQTPRTVDWQLDVVHEPSRLIYELRYSTGQSLGAVELIARSWEHAVTGTRRHSPSLKISALAGSRHSSKGLSTKETATAAGIAVSEPNMPTEHIAAHRKLKDETPEQTLRRLAIGKLEHAIVAGETAELWNDLAALHFGNGEAALAEQGFRHALVLDASHREAAINLALILLERGQIKEVPTLLNRHRSTLSEEEKRAIRVLSARLRPPSETRHLENESQTVVSNSAIAAPTFAGPEKRGKRFLVVVRAGNESLHPLWLQGSGERTWDLLVHSFGSECPWSNEDGVEIVRAEGPEVRGPKMRAIHLLYERRKSYFQSYDYIFLPDDDLAGDMETVNNIFMMCEHFGLEYAQPAITPDSFASMWPITVENTSFLLRYTNFAEIMAPIFSRPFFEKCAPTFNESMSGYGLDILWSSWVSSFKKIAILDGCPMRHTRPNRSGQLYKDLHEMEVNPDQELRDFIEKWRLVSAEELIPGQTVVPLARILGGILRDQRCLTIQDGNGVELLRAVINGFPPTLNADAQKIAALLQPIMQQMLVPRFLDWV